MSEHKYQCIPPKNYISVWSCVLKHRSQNETVSLPRSSFLLHLFKASVLHATGLRDRPPGAHVHLHDGAFLLIEAAGGTMHCIWPSRFLRCRHGGAFPFVSAFHFSLSLCAVESKRYLLRAKSTAFLGEQSKHGREEKLRTRAR